MLHYQVRLIFAHLKFTTSISAATPSIRRRINHRNSPLVARRGASRPAESARVSRPACTSKWRIHAHVSIALVGNYRSDMQIAAVTTNARLTVTLLTDRYTMSGECACASVRTENKICVNIYIYIYVRHHWCSWKKKFAEDPWELIGKTIRKEREKREYN